MGHGWRESQILNGWSWSSWWGTIEHIFRNFPEINTWANMKKIRYLQYETFFICGSKNMHFKRVHWVCDGWLMACVRLPPMCSKANMDLVLIVCHHLRLARSWRSWWTYRSLIIIYFIVFTPKNGNYWPLVVTEIMTGTKEVRLDNFNISQPTVNIVFIYYVTTVFSIVKHVSLVMITVVACSP